MPPLPPPRPPRRRRPNNHIDQDEAEKIGDFLVSIGDEVTQSNDTLRETALRNADLRAVSEYFRIQKVDAEYRMFINVGRSRDGVERQREAEVVMNATYERIAPPGVDQAPFNVLFGVISPAERHREAVLSKLKEETELEPPVDAPIFSLGGEEFWVVYPDEMTHYVVSLGAPGWVTPVTDLQQLNQLTGKMFRFMRDQLSKTYGESHV